MRNELLAVAFLCGAATPLGAQDLIPAGWTRCGQGGVVTVDSTYRVDGGRSLVLLATTGGSGQVQPCVQQVLDARPYRRDQLVATALLRGTSAAEGGLWLVIYGPGGAQRIARGEVRFAEDTLRLIQSQWTEFEVHILVPEGADSVALGLSSLGGWGSPRSLWADRVTFTSMEVRGWRMGDSPPPSPPFPSRPVVVFPVPTNLSFEQ